MYVAQLKNSIKKNCLGFFSQEKQSAMHELAALASQSSPRIHLRGALKIQIASSEMKWRCRAAPSYQQAKVCVLFFLSLPLAAPAIFLFASVSEPHIYIKHLCQSFDCVCAGERGGGWGRSAISFD
jgi:hypothetical protein